MSDFSVSAADMQNEISRGALEQFWDALMAGKNVQAAEIYHVDAVLYLPQTREEIAGLARIAAHGMLEPDERLVKVNSITGDGGIWVCECETLRQQQPTLLVSVAEMQGATIVRERRYRAPVHPGARAG